MFPAHASSFIGHIPGSLVDIPILQSINSRITEGLLSVFSGDVAFGDDAGNDQLLVAVCMSEPGDAIHSAPKYNGVAGTLFDQQDFSPTGPGTTVSVSYWLNAEMPASASSFVFEMTYDITQLGHAVFMSLWKDVDQQTPLGIVVKSTKQIGVPTFPMSNFISNAKDSGVILVCAAARSTGPTFVVGDILDAGSNMNDISSIIPRNPAPGAALVHAHDIVPTSNETYVFDVNYGNATVVESAQAMIIEVRGDPLADECSPGSIVIPNLDTLSVAPTNAAVGAQMNTNGGVYYYENSTTRNFPVEVNGGIWIGSCTNDNYDARWTQSGDGDAPTFVNAPEGIWVQMSVDNVSIEYEVTSNLKELSGDFTFEVRRRSDNQIIVSDQFFMSAEVEAAGK